MTFATHAEKMYIEFWCGSAIFGVLGENVGIGGRGAVDVVTELAVAGWHRVYVRRGDVDVVQQRFTSLLVVAVVVRGRNVAVITPVQVDLRPVDRLAAGAEVLEQLDAGASAGEHDVSYAACVDRPGDGSDESLAGCRDEGVGVGVLLDDGAHRYFTLSMPLSAAK